MENRKTSFMDRLETFLKFSTPIGAIVVFLIGIYHYRDSQAEEFKKSYWEKRYHTYEEVCSLSAHIANAGNAAEIDSLKNKFWILYSGKAMLVEDLHVYNALHSFGRSLNRATFPDSLQVLQTKAHDISHACRKSLKETWEPVPVSEIQIMEN